VTEIVGVGGEVEGGPRETRQSQTTAATSSHPPRHNWQRHQGTVTAQPHKLAALGWAASSLDSPRGKFGWEAIRCDKTRRAAAWEVRRQTSSAFQGGQVPRAMRSPCSCVQLSGPHISARDHAKPASALARVRQKLQRPLYAKRVSLQAKAPIPTFFCSRRTTTITAHRPPNTSRHRRCSRILTRETIVVLRPSNRRHFAHHGARTRCGGRRQSVLPASLPTVHPRVLC
jgi:hypothetical protein